MGIPDVVEIWLEMLIKNVILLLCFGTFCSLEEP